MDLSIIVPLAPNETLDSRLIDDLCAQKTKVAQANRLELILVSLCETTLKENLRLGLSHGLNVRGIKAQKKHLESNNRATCLNAGALAATHEWLLFCHADSFFQNDFVEPLRQFVHESSTGLGYYNLRFSDGSPLMVLNTWGVRFRCRFLKTPFGDQGLFMSRQTWQNLGQFPLETRYGEDHLLVRRAKAMGMPIQTLGMRIFTSARKYMASGWLKTTFMHQWLWYKQIYEDRKRYR